MRQFGYMVQKDLGFIVLESDPGVGLKRLWMTQEPPEIPESHDFLLETAKELLVAYFRGEAIDFKQLPLALEGTPFQKAVWQTLRDIPYGETQSYQWLAEQVGDIKSVRAVGQANGKNPLPIIIPCHRIIQKDGNLGGYSGGLSVKRYLLNFEQTHKVDAHLKQLALLA